MPGKLKDITIYDAVPIFRNFAGRAGPMNSEGDRNFCVNLTPELATKLEKEGWNVKYHKVREEGDEPGAYIKVKLNYEKGRPPRCVTITPTSTTELGSGEVSLLDAADIASADMVISPYEYDFNGNQGVSAYLKSLFVTLNQDELEKKYADILQNASAGLEEGGEE